MYNLNDEDCYWAGNGGDRKEYKNVMLPAQRYSLFRSNVVLYDGLTRVTEVKIRHWCARYSFVKSVLVSGWEHWCLCLRHTIVHW